MKINKHISPATSYYSNGRMNYSPSAVWYESDLYNVDFDGVNVVAKMIGKTQDSMREVYCKIGGLNISTHLSKQQIDIEIAEIQARILLGLQQFSVPSEANIAVGRRMWKREINNSLDEAIETLLCCRRFSAREKRYFAKKLVESNTISPRQLLNFMDKLMLY